MVTDVIAVSDVPVDRIVEVVGRAESSSEHPLGRAMYKFAEGYGADCSSGSDGFKAVPGRGLECTIDADRVRIGNKASKYAHLPTCLSTCPAACRHAHLFVPLAAPFALNAPILLLGSS